MTYISNRSILGIYIILRIKSLLSSYIILKNICFYANLLPKSKKYSKLNESDKKPESKYYLTKLQGL